MYKREKKIKKGIYRQYIKRKIDFVLSSLFILLFWWVYLIVGVMVRVKLGSPVLFKQPRPGKDGKIFNLYKFRSMTDARDKRGNLLPDELRLTKFGRWLRASSLDELPEIFSIWIGTMSICGPRPLLLEYLPYYTNEELRRHEVRPGLTGWAQVNGRNVTEWDERLQQDIYYVEHCTFLMDFKILVMTVFKVFRQSDILMGNQHKPGRGRLDEERKDWVEKDTSNSINS